MFASGISCRMRRQHVRAVHPRHHPIEDRQRRLNRDTEPVERLDAVANERGLVVPPLKCAGQNLAGYAIVFGDEDLHKS